MSSELVKKVVEAGIVPAQAVELMQMWKCLDDDLPDVEKQKQTEEKIMKFVQEIADLLYENEIPEMRETMPGIDQVFRAQANAATFRFRTPVGWDNEVMLLAMEDALGYLLVWVKDDITFEALQVGSFVKWKDAWNQIINVMPMYTGREVRFMKCELRSVPSAEVPSLSEKREE